MFSILNASPSHQPFTMEGHCCKGYVLMGCFPSYMGHLPPISTAEYVQLKACSSLL